MKWTLEKKSLLGASIVIVFFIVSDCFLYENFRSMASSSNWVIHTGQVLHQLQALESTIATSESAARGYAIAGAFETRTAYDLAESESKDSLEQLRQLTVDNPSQRRRLDLLLPLVNRRWTLLDQLISSRDEGSDVSARQVELVREGQHNMSEIHEALRQMADEEYRLLEERSNTASRSRRRTEKVVVIEGIIALLVVVGGAVTLHNDFVTRNRTEAALRFSEERFRLLVRDVRNYAIFMLSPDGLILSWNLGAERINGYPSEEIIGKHFSIFYTSEDIEAGKPERALRIAAEEGSFEEEGWRLRKDGTRFLAHVILTALRDDHGGLRGFAKVTRDDTERSQAHEALRDLSGRLLRAQDQERRRLAREIHDGTAQILAAMHLHVLRLENTLPQDSAAARESLSELVDLVNHCGSEIRTLSHLLHPPLLEDAGLGSALRSYAEGFGQRSGINVATHVPNDFPRFNSDIETALFRVTQEALANIHRHSGSSTAQIEATLFDGRIQLEITDQGRGIPSDILRAPSKLGVGIRGMTERLRLLGGELTIESNAQGTTVRAELPLATPLGTRA